MDRDHQGLAALGAVVFASVYLLRSHELSFSLDAAAALETADAEGLDRDDPARVVRGLTYVLSSMQAENSLTVGRLRTSFAWALGGLVVEIFGLGLGAALA